MACETATEKPKGVGESPSKTVKRGMDVAEMEDAATPTAKKLKQEEEIKDVEDITIKEVEDVMLHGDFKDAEDVKMNGEANNDAENAKGNRGAKGARSVKMDIFTPTPERQSTKTSSPTEASDDDDENPRSGDQFERVVLALEIALDVARTLQPGYQLINHVSKNESGRYVCVSEEKQHVDYWHDYMYKKSFVTPMTVSRSEQEAGMEIKMNRIRKLARGMQKNERLILEITCDSSGIIHINASFEDLPRKK